MERCKYCGNNEANYVVNPWHVEMNDAEVYEWICSDCYTELLADV